MEQFVEVIAEGIVEEYLGGLAVRTSDAGLGGALTRGALLGVGFAVVAGTVRASRGVWRPVMTSAVLAGDRLRALTSQARGVVHEIYVEAQTDRARRSTIPPG